MGEWRELIPPTEVDKSGERQRLKEALDAASKEVDDAIKGVKDAVSELYQSGS